MHIPKMNDKIKLSVNGEYFLGEINYIDQTNLFNHEFSPIQVKLHQPVDESKQTLYRVSLKEIIPVFVLIVAGGRDFKDCKLMTTKLNSLLKNKDKESVVIVSGGAKGADSLGERYGMEKGYTIVPFAPDWSIGKHAGILRKKEMADYADALCAFWNGKSKGTANMIETAEKQGLQVRVVNY